MKITHDIDPDSMDVGAAILRSIARRCEQAAEAIADFAVHGDLDPEKALALDGWPKLWGIDTATQSRMQYALRAHATLCRAEAEQAERTAANRRAFGAPDEPWITRVQRPRRPGCECASGAHGGVCTCH